jgi:hypothetical protein
MPLFPSFGMYVLVVYWKMLIFCCESFHLRILKNSKFISSSSVDFPFIVFFHNCL